MSPNIPKGPRNKTTLESLGYPQGPATLIIPRILYLLRMLTTTALLQEIRHMRLLDEAKIPSVLIIPESKSVRATTAKTTKDASRSRKECKGEASHRNIAKIQSDDNQRHTSSAEERKAK